MTAVTFNLGLTNTGDSSQLIKKIYENIVSELSFSITNWFGNEN